MPEERNRWTGKREIDDSVILSNDVFVFIPRAAVNKSGGRGNFKWADIKFDESLNMSRRQVFPSPFHSLSCCRVEVGRIVESGYDAVVI